MKFMPSLGEISQKATNAFTRFPITLLWAISGTIFTIWYVGVDGYDNDDTPLVKVIIIAALGVSWLIGTRFLINYFKEVKQQNNQWIILVPLLFLGWFYGYLPNTETAFNTEIYGYKIALYAIAGHLLVFFSPFALTWNKNAYWNYLKTVFIAIARSFLFSLVLYLGVTLALLALKYLFKIDFDDKTYFKLFIFCLGIVNTWIFLADFPQKIHKNTTVNYPKALEVFVKYILIPLSLLYLAILYAYSFKILINWSLPKGWVSYLVIALSVLGFVIHILINPIKKTIESRLINRFYPWFYILLLPMLLLLFTAIYKRISQYGFTENRYFLLVLASWILGMTLYILISKQKQLRYFSMILMIVLLLVSFGFWSAFSISEKSQLHQFSKVYNNIKTKDFKISLKEKERFGSIIRYLAKRNSIDKTASTLGFNPKEAFSTATNWSMSSKIIDSLKIKVVYNDKEYGYTKTAFFGINESKNVFEIKEYDYFKILNSYKMVSSKSAQDSIQGFTMYLDYKKSTFHISDHTINLKAFLNKLSNKESDYDISPKELTIEKEFKDMRVKLIFKSISIHREKGDATSINNANMYIFLKLKNDAQ